MLSGALAILECPLSFTGASTDSYFLGCQILEFQRQESSRDGWRTQVRKIAF